MHQNFLGFVLVAILAFQGQTTSESSPAIRHENQDGFTVIGLTTRTTNAREAGPDGQIKKLWVRYAHGALARIPERADENLVVVYSGYTSDEHGEYDYTLGLRVKDGTVAPTGFVARYVEPGPYAVLLSDPGLAPEVVPALWRKIWTLTPADLGGRRAYATDFEIYPPGQQEDETTVAIHLGLKP